jgi:hypothetical protein
MFKKLMLSIVVLLCSMTTIKSQQYDRLFKYELPEEKYILTLDKYINSTPIFIDANPQHFTHIDN